MEPEIHRAERMPEQRMSYPFTKMQVGDEFTVPVQYTKTVRVAASKRGKKMKMKFSCNARFDKKLRKRVIAVVRTA